VNRRILIQVTTPGLIIGLVLFGACFVSAWYIDRLQSNMAKILQRHVASLQAAQELEIRVRQLQYHELVNLADPKRQARRTNISQDRKDFEKALESARRSAATPEEESLIARIKESYDQYLKELEQVEAEVGRQGSSFDFVQFADKHPIKKIVEPCQKLREVSQDTMDWILADTTGTSHQVRLLMILLGIAGPFGGLLVGFAVARGLSRSIYQLSVRVQDVAQRLDQDVAAVSIQADGDMASLDRQLQRVVQRVEEVAERLRGQQRELLRAEQLSAVGQLAASVAHEVRNPLTSVKMLVEAALRTQDAKALTANDLQVIHGEIVRLERTVQSFLDFTRLPTPKRSHCDMRQVINQAVEIVRLRARQQKVEIVIHGPGHPLPTYVDPDQVCHVLVNLFLNALDAMPSGGRLEITLEEMPDAMLGITVADTGCGIPNEIQDRLFTPFASSKPTGTGLGLSISRRIVEEHGGAIAASSRPEEGACFTITLPAEPGIEDGRSKNGTRMNADSADSRRSNPGKSA
jgi:signal transduction histidine kinase